MQPKRLQGSTDFALDKPLK